MGNTNELYDDSQGHPHYREDLIDFPVSNVFADYYFQEGYSTYRPPQSKRQASASDANLKRKVESLEIKGSGLQAEFEGLTRKVEALSQEIEDLKAQPPTKRNGRSIGVPVEDLE